MIKNKIFGMLIALTLVIVMGVDSAMADWSQAQSSGPGRAGELAAPAASAAPPGTHTVDNIGDGSDASPGDGVCETAAGNGICTLRAAIEEANARTGADKIFFDDSIGMIIPNSALPSIADYSSGTTIRGNPTWILGSFAGNSYGLTLASNNNKLQGLIISNFERSGVWVGGNNNVIGTDGDGVNDGSEGNVISSNGENGVLIRYDVTGNRLAGNLIGLTLDGTGDAGNALSGVKIESVSEFSGASSNLIGTNGDGTSDVLERNVISGNDGWGISIEGSGVSIDQTVIAGNYIGTNAAGDAAIPNTEGGVKVSSWGTNTLIGTDGDGIADGVEGNVISGNEGPGVLLTSSTSSGTVIAGNYIGIDAAGDATLPNLYGVQIQYGSTNNLIGTDADGASDELERNVISGNDDNGILFSGDSDQNVVAGNYIGTDAAGNAALPNNKGIRIVQCSNNRIGGTLAAERNVISGNQSAGVVFDSASASLVQGNYIGTDASGSGNLGNEGPGVSLIEGSFDNTIGGTTNGAANRIAFNGTDGIILGDTSYDNSLRGNAIFANGGLGIDLYPGNDVTLNDLGDGDSGANNLQNYPVLSSVAINGGQITIQGTLNSSGNTTYNLDFYANSSCDPSGYGEGEIYLGSDTVMTNGSGDASFTATLPGSVPAGTCVTATATDPGGNTSEFSTCSSVEGSTAVYLPLVIRDYD